MQSSKEIRVASRSVPQKLVWCFRVALAFLLAVVVWEVLLSQLVLQKPTSQSHPVLGRIYGEGLYVQGKEGYGRTVLNELGLRSRPLETALEGQQRVLVLGDSYTQAMQVSDEVAFPQRLNDLLGDNTRVINSGREGASPADYIALEEYNKTTFQPDVVVVQLNEADFTRDLLSNKQTFYYEETSQGYNLRENKSVVSSNALASRFADLQSVFNFSVVRVALERVEAMRKGEPVPTPEVQTTSQQSDGSLEHFIVGELKQAYQHPILLYIPEMDYFSPDYAQPRATEQYLADAAQKLGVTFISLRPDFVALYRNQNRTAHGFNNTQPGMGHINPLGHEIAAERLAQVLGPQVANSSTADERLSINTFATRRTNQ